MAILSRLPAFPVLASPALSRRWPVLALALFCAACGSGKGALEVAIVGDSADLFENSPRLSVAGQYIRAATVEGLVGLDADGQVIPALADRWIVTDDGRSYIFRLRDGDWPDGSELTGETARDTLRRAVRRLDGTPLGRDLSQIDQIRAMAGRVIEIRLKGPMPDFLQLLAQPELGLARDGRGTGPMRMRRVGKSALLSMMSPEERGLPMVEGWKDTVRGVHVAALPAALAIARFDDGQVDVVLNGRIESMPLADTGPLSRGTVRIDPAIGLFGLAVARADGLLADPAGREALAMAIDRDALVAPFNVGGWNATTRVVAPGLPGDPGTNGERWAAMTVAQRQAAAASRVSAWRAAHGGKPVEITVDLPDGPGSNVLFTQLFADTAKIGVTLRRVKPGEGAALVMVDRVARYASPRWFLNQFACAVQPVCSATADQTVAAADEADDPAQRANLLAQAEAQLTQANVYIPFGQPVRFTLVRARVTGFSPNQWVFHPLPPLASVTK